MRHDLQERIAERAHRLWEEAGRPDGHHDAHWHQAEAEIASEETGGDVASDDAAASGTGDIAPAASELPSDPPPPGEPPAQPVGGPGGASRRKGR